MDFYYANTAYRGAGTDRSYYCRIIRTNFGEEEFWLRLLGHTSRGKKGLQVLSFL